MDTNLPDNKNARIEQYLSERPAKYHQIKLLDMIEADRPGFDAHLLDIACASGAFLAQARQRFPAATLHGCELSQELADIGSERLKDLDIDIEIADASNYRPEIQYDVLTASGILSIFQDPLIVLDHWLGWLKPVGALYIFGRFNSDPVDVRIVHRNRFDDRGWETGHTNFSIQTITEHLEKSGYSADFEEWIMPEKIEKPATPDRSYTLELADGSLVQVNGANIVVQQFHVRITQA